MMFDKFLARIEADYGNHGNSYHNATHAADVAQTVHYLIHSTGLEVSLLRRSSRLLEITVLK